MIHYNTKNQRSAQIFKLADMSGELVQIGKYVARTYYNSQISRYVCTSWEKSGNDRYLHKMKRGEFVGWALVFNMSHFQSSITAILNYNVLTYWRMVAAVTQIRQNVNQYIIWVS